MKNLKRLLAAILTLSVTGLALADVSAPGSGLGPQMGGSGGASYDGTGVDVIVATTSVESSDFILQDSSGSNTMTFRGGDHTGTSVITVLAGASTTTFSIDGGDRIAFGSPVTIEAVDLRIQNSGGSVSFFNDIPAYFGSSAFAQLEFETTQTVDSLILATDNTSNIFLITEVEDIGFNFAHSAQSNPTLFIHSGGQSTTQWVSLTHDGTDAIFSTGTGNLHFNATAVLAGNSRVALNSGLWFGAIGDTDNAIGARNEQTPDTAGLWTGSTGNSWLIAEVADRTFDFAHAAQTNPTLFIHSANQSTTQWLGLTHDGTNAVITTGAGAVNIPSAPLFVQGTSSGFSISTDSDDDSGIQFRDAGAIVIYSNNAGRMLWGPSSVAVQTPINWVADGGGVAGSPDLGLKRAAAGVMQITDGSTGEGTLRAGDGTANVPAYSFANATGTGFYLVSARVAFASSAGVVPIFFDSTATSLSLSSTWQVGWSSGASTAAATDVGLGRTAVGVLKVTNGSTGDGQLSLDTTGHRIASNRVTLTEAGGAETVATITTATTEMTGGFMTYVVRIADAAGGPDYTVRSGHLRFAMTNSAGTTTCAGSAASEATDTTIVTGGVAKTNTFAITYVTGANTCEIKFNIDSDIATVTTANITYTITLDGPGTVS